MIAAAFDLGLKRTGVAWAGDSELFESPAHLHRSPMDDTRITERLTWWADTFDMILLAHTGQPIAVEAPFVHPKHMTGAMRLIELHGVFRLCARRAGCTVQTVTPAALKKWATGSGNAAKVDMIARAVELGCGSNDDNEADAWLLYTMLATDGPERVVLERTDEGQREFRR